MKNRSQVFTNEEIKNFYSKEVKEQPTAHASKELIEEYFDPLSYMMAIDYQTYMVDDILQKVDRAAMSTSLEGREPFLDQSIIEWAAKLPNEYKYHKGEKNIFLNRLFMRIKV